MSDYEEKMMAALGKPYNVVYCDKHDCDVAYIDTVRCALCHIRELEAKLEEKLAGLTSHGVEVLHIIDQQSDSIDKLKAENGRMRESLINLRECNWVITLPDRMDAVREIAREALGD